MLSTYYLNIVKIDKYFLKNKFEFFTKYEISKTLFYNRFVFKKIKINFKI